MRNQLKFKITLKLSTITALQSKEQATDRHMCTSSEMRLLPPPHTRMYICVCVSVREQRRHVSKVKRVMFKRGAWKNACCLIFPGCFQFLRALIIITKQLCAFIIHRRIDKSTTHTFKMLAVMKSTTPRSLVSPC